MSDQIRAVIINTGPERMSSAAVAHLVSRVRELLPQIPVALLSGHEDPENIRQAFELGVRGFIPTSLTSMVAAEAVHLVCLGGTFAPAASLLSPGCRPQDSKEEEPLIERFTQRQAQILDCLRRGMANKLIAYELKMCESTVKVHVRNIMKKLKATNRTQVVYLTSCQATPAASLTAYVDRESNRLKGPAAAKPRRRRAWKRRTDQPRRAGWITRRRGSGCGRGRRGARAPGARGRALSACAARTRDRCRRASLQMCPIRHCKTRLVSV